MKKFMLMLAVAVLMLGSVFAEDVDFSKYNDAALTALLQQVQQEIVERGIKKTVELVPGVYIGGVDIPIGNYLAELGEGKHKKRDWKLFTCDAEGNDLDSYNEGDPVNCRVRIVEGGELHSFCDVKLTPQVIKFQ